MYSSERKRALCGWLKKNHRKEFSSPLKMQKYLFFYELLSKMENGDAELDTLKGYKNGPVFSDVFGDRRHEELIFEKEVENVYERNPFLVDEERAKFSGFLVSIMSDQELSELTHQFNIWNSKSERIKRNEKQVPLDEKDFNSDDQEILNTLREAYPTEYINSVYTLDIGAIHFVIDIDNADRISEAHMDILWQLSKNKDLENPVYIDFSENGVLLVD